jgi:hypothetical protein
VYALPKILYGCLPHGTRKHWPLRMALPSPDHQHHQRGAHGQNGDWHDPGNDIEALHRRSREDCRSVLLHESLQYQIVVVAALQASREFDAHRFRLRAAHVIAFQQDLTAATATHEVMTETLEAWGIAVST